MGQPVISILGEDIPCNHETLLVNKLKYLDSNPRVYSSISGKTIPKGPEERQGFIEEHMMNEPSVQKLMPRIKRDGGLQEPIIVRYDTMEVIEGNSRLTVYRHLQKTDGDNADKWESIPCLTVSTLTKEQQYAYLNQVHVEGKTPWVTYEKANLAYVMQTKEKLTNNEIMKTLQIGQSELEKRTKVISMMATNKDGDKSHFSHYDVLTRNRVIREELEANPKLKEVLLKKILKPSFTAQHLRDKLPTVIGKRKVLTRFMEDRLDLDEAHQEAKLSGPGQKLKAALDKVKSIENPEVQNLSPNETNAALQTAKQLCKACERTRALISDRKEKLRQ